MKKKSLAYFKKIVKEFDFDEEIEEGANYKTALFMLAALQEGPNIKKLSSFTGIPRSFIAERARRLRENGIWKGSKTISEWSDKKTGGIAFCCDVLVAEGLLERGGE